MCMIHIYLYGALRNYDLFPLFSVVQVRAHMPFAGCWFGSTPIMFREIHLPMQYTHVYTGPNWLLAFCCCGMHFWSYPARASHTHGHCAIGVAVYTYLCFLFRLFYFLSLTQHNTHTHAHAVASVPKITSADDHTHQMAPDAIQEMLLLFIQIYYISDIA